MNKTKSISIFAVAITASCTIALMAVLSMPQTASAQFVQISPTSTTAVIDAPLNPDTTKLLAKRILVANLTTGQILYEKDSATPQPIASLAKLMTAITAREIYATWPNPPQKIKLISRTAAFTAADRQIAVGGYMKTNDLVSYMLLSSSNFAAQSLATGIIPYTSFISYKNFTARKLGLTESNFVNASGLTEKNKTSSAGSARDMMKLLDLVVKKYPELATATRSEDAVIKTSSGKAIAIDNPNKSLEKIQNVFLGKTGYTDEAGGNLTIVVRRNGNYYGIVVLSSTVDGRFSDAEYLASLIPLNR